MNNLQQQKIWDEEHAKPTVLKQMDSEEASSGVVLITKWLTEHEHDLSSLRGIEMGCGKGRNGMYLASQGIQMESFDFAPSAITEAERRQSVGGQTGVHFFVQDATVTWPFENNTFDFGIDIFASTDIVTESGRAFAREEFFRVLKPGGFLFLYLLSTDDTFHAQMLEQHPVTDERHAFQHPQTGKFEKVYDHEEILESYKKFTLVEERRIEKVATFFDTTYPCKHFWTVYQKV